MQILNLIVDNYQQFQKTVLDFTYPEGHPSAGLPLRKVCFIGQSGTGKTTLLKLIRQIVNPKGKVQQFEKIKDELKNELLDNIIYSGKIIRGKDTVGTVTYTNNETVSCFANESLFPNSNKELLNYLQKNGVELILYPAEIVESFSRILNENIDETNQIFASTENQEIKDSLDKEIFKLKSAYDFSKDNPMDIWKGILQEASDYKIKEINFSQEITKAILEDLDNVNQLVEKYKQWTDANPSPLKKLATKLNPILEKFQLNIDLSGQIESSEEIKFIKIKSLNNTTIPYNTWSTGTKQLLLTATPLIFLNTKQAVVLLDEPERSLFPDVQRTLVNDYVDIAPNAQFFVATHSPIIASQFEPCERFILYFDKKGNTRFRSGAAPLGDDPNDLLTKDFGMQQLLGPQGVKKLKEYIELKTKISQEQDPKVKSNLAHKMMKIGNAYGFGIDENELI